MNMDDYNVVYGDGDFPFIHETDEHTKTGKGFSIEPLSYLDSVLIYRKDTSLTPLSDIDVRIYTSTSSINDAFYPQRGVVARVTANDTYYNLYWRGGPHTYLDRVNNGVVTNLWYVNSHYTAGDLRLVLFGAQWFVYRSSDLKKNNDPTKTWQLLATDTDTAPITGPGSAGFRFVQGNITEWIVFDDLFIGSVADV